MQTSPNDQKHYKHLTLDNGLKVLLVHDQQATKSAASLAVKVGHFDDPRSREGLAHFLEHMLFLGTASFPKAGEFQSFINRHGGHNNAWTGTEFTNYFFDIENEWFEEGLERFSQFFVCPLFDEELVDKERQAVDSEYHLKINDDTRRIYQVHKETVNQAHPFSKFSVGNIDTLADHANNAVRDELIAFYQSQYSADIMSLVIISPLNHQQIEQMVTQLFSEVPKVERKAPAEVPLYLPEQLGLELHIEPLKEMRKLTMSFGFGETNSLYRTKPLTFLGHLIGYEGPGSLIALLRNTGLINAMAAGGGISGSNFKDFTISFTLTEEGMECIDDIVGVTFAYLRLIKEQGLQAWRYQEKQQVLERAFLFQEETRAIDYASHLSLNLHHYPTEDVIYGDYVMDKYDQALIEQCLDQLQPENMRLSIVAQGLETDKVARWYNTPYSVHQISQQRLQEWHDYQLPDGLYLSAANPFLSYNKLELFTGDKEQAQPELLVDDEGFRLWFSNEPEFQVPKGHIFVSVDSSFAVASPRNIACSRLVIELLLDHLTEMTYQAEIAGMAYQLYSHQGGFTLRLSGFAEKQLLLLKMILSNRQFGHVDPRRFKVIKQQLSRHWLNQLKVKPISQLFNHLSAILQPNNPPAEELAAELESVEVEELPEFIEQLYQHIHIEMLAYGSWEQTQVEHMASFIRKELAPHALPSSSTPRRLVSIKERGTLLHQVDCNQEDSALMIYYQSRDISPEAIALFTLSNHIMTSSFFNELRTKQQLGYIVGTGNLPLNRHPGIIFYVQSPHGHPQQLLDAINDFLDQFPVLMFELSHAQWEQSKKGLISQIMEPETNMRSRAQRFWVSIGNKDYDFSQRKRVAECVENLERADLVRFMMSLKSKQRDRVVVYSYGKQHETMPLSTHYLEGAQEITDRRVFHQQSQIYSYGGEPLSVPPQNKAC